MNDLEGNTDKLEDWPDLEADASTRIALMVAKRIGEECERTGRKTFTMGDLRRIKREIFEGK